MPARRICCRCCEVLAMESPALSANPSTLCSPWASSSSNSSRCACASALATAANWMNRASFGLGIDIITISVVNYSIELLNGMKINGLSRGLTDPMLPFEISIRLAAFAGVFVLMAGWELLAPRRHQTAERPLRWSSNLGVVVLDTILVRILVPTTAVAIALLAEERGWGFFHAFAVPAWLAILASVIVLDLAFDVTTGVRFHPIEILLSMLTKLAFVAALGAPTLAVLLFEVLLNATSMFSHGNVRVPERLDRMLRWIVVTPDMHRVHHSVAVPETNSNFGFNLPWWDRMFGTYRAQPIAGHDAMTIGIEQFRERSELRLDRMLLQPFREDVGAYPIGRRDKDPR